MAFSFLPSSARREFVTVALTIAIAVSARSSLADHYVVPTGSMLPTVQLDDHVVVDKLAYGLRLPLGGEYAVHFSPPSRGDVVVLRSPENGDVLLKRVVGLPGDEVAVRDGALTIDGRTMPIIAGESDAIELLDGVKHSVRLTSGGGPDYASRRLPAGRFLVMGDNRGNSHDGRDFGLVERDAILGRVEGVIIRHGAPTWIGLTRDSSK